MYLALNLNGDALPGKVRDPLDHVTGADVGERLQRALLNGNTLHQCLNDLTPPLSVS